MPNRQHGRSRNPSGGRAARTVPVSRAPADSRGTGGTWMPSQPGTPAYVEPEVRRWPHPLEEEPSPSASAPEPALHYIRCALSYQNQLLADIKALLEQLAAAGAAAAGPAAEAENKDENLSKL